MLATTGYDRAKDLDCDAALTQCPECTAPARAAVLLRRRTPPSPPAVRGRGQCRWGTRASREREVGRLPEAGSAEYRPPDGTVEYCDGLDNDCNGVVDDGAVCPDQLTCEHGVCVPDACGTELPPPEGYTCNPTGDSNGVVILGTCGVTAGGAPQTCADGALCQYGTCIDPCPTSTVGGERGQRCLRRGDHLRRRRLHRAAAATRSAAPRRARSAAPGVRRRPVQRALLPERHVLPPGRLRAGLHLRVLLQRGEVRDRRLLRAGPVRRAHLQPRRALHRRHLRADPCLGKSCASGQVCEPRGSEAVCVDDPCAGVVCPAGVCASGQCFPTGNRTGAGTVSRTASESSPSGCGCGSGAGTAFPALLALLAAPLLRRRRAPRAPRGEVGGGLLLLLFAVALSASACKPVEDEFDPSTCRETCGEQRCVDTSTDPAHCGGCASAACGGGEKCVDGTCGPSSAVAPYIRTLSPTSGKKDDPNVTVTLTGERFAANATVRMETPLGPRTVQCPSAPGSACQWLGAGSIKVKVDLTGAPVAAGTPPWKLRVVNPDLVISNAMSFNVIVPVPAIATVVPSEVVAGTSATLLVTPTGAAGTGFTSGSRCRLQGPSVAELELQTTFDGVNLACVVDAAGLLPYPGYVLTVVSEAGVRSNGKTVVVASSAPVVFAVDPNSATTDVALSVTGARFDSTCRVVLYPQAQTLTDATPVLAGMPYVDSGRLFVPRFTLPVDGSYLVAVRKGASAPYQFSNAVAFTAGGAQSSIISFSPSTAFEGEPVVPLAFAGLLPVDVGDRAAAPGGTMFASLPSTASGCAGPTCTARLGDEETSSARRTARGSPGFASDPRARRPRRRGRCASSRTRRSCATTRRRPTRSRRGRSGPQGARSPSRWRTSTASAPTSRA